MSAAPPSPAVVGALGGLLPPLLQTLERVGWVHWMFPVATARRAREALEAAGARLVYRELEDLSHTYPRDENPRIFDWLMGG